MAYYKSLPLILLFLAIFTGFDHVEKENMVLVPAGSFLMGAGESDIEKAVNVCLKFQPDCEKSFFAGSTPQRPIFLDSYLIDITEVTAGDYIDFLNTHGNECGGKPCFSDYGNENIVYQEKGKWFVKDHFQENPITDVSWEGADKYCKWKNKRLPTEAEWEKAAKGSDSRTKIAA